jgi:taurine dioxygenase
MSDTAVIEATRQNGGQPPFTLERVTGTLGAEVKGLDLSQILPDSTIAALSAALVEHKTLFFRDQDITGDQHIAFGRRFGPLEVHPFTEGSSTFSNAAGHEEIIRVESTPDKPSAAARWHSDVTWRETPSLASVIRSRISPPYGGDTLWADMVAAYEALDDATRSRISGMTAFHDWHMFRAKMRRDGVAEERIAELQKAFPPAEHPIVRTHPVSGEKLLYVNSGFTTGVKGMDEAESKPLLERLYRQADLPEVQVRFRWRPNSIAFWDNRSTQHYAVPDFYPQHRLMERVTVAGDKPF